MTLADAVFVVDALIVAFGLCVGLLLAHLAALEREAAPDQLRAARAKALSESAGLRVAEPFVIGFAVLVRRLGFVERRAHIERLLHYSGNPWGYSAAEHMGLCLTVAMFVFFGALLILFALTGAFSPLPPLGLAVLGFFFTHRDLVHRADRRRTLVNRQMPYVLDLISLTMAAGATFLQACETAVQGARRGPLQDELDQMLHEVGAGTTLREALTNMTKRSNSEELAVLVGAVVQGEELGTPLVQILETQAGLNRFRRTKTAEQEAAKIPNRMAVPTVFLMLSVLLLLFGPIIVKAARGGMF